MQIKDVYPLIYTHRLKDAKAFYIERFDMEATFEIDQAIYLSKVVEGSRFGLGFVVPHSPHNEALERLAERAGAALTLVFHVEDAQRELNVLRAKGIEPEVPMSDEPWGQRHFMMQDPIGLWVDVVQEIEPDPDFFTCARRETALPPPPL